MGQNNRDKETKHLESSEWSKNTELERRTGDRVTVALDFEEEYPEESMVKNRHAGQTKPEAWKGQYELSLYCFTDVVLMLSQTR